MHSVPRIVTDLDDVMTLSGADLGVSDWHGVDQATINGFAEVTGDRFWIHTDPVRAAEAGGTTIAHGLLVLSLGPRLQYTLLDLRPVGSVLNYGYERVRFPAPTPAGTRVRLRLSCRDVKGVGPAAVRVELDHTFEAEGQERPVCVALQTLHVQASS